MQKFYQIMEEKIKNSLSSIGYSDEFVIITSSNRPDLGEFQYNGVMNLAKIYHQNPREIADKLVRALEKDSFFKNVNMAGPGFINLSISDEALIDFINHNDYSYEAKNKLIFLDYGGANVAKALHVGHLRSANIGEALKRLCEYLGYKTISDAHLGDWGRPLGLVIYELSLRNPDWKFFDKDYEGEYENVSITPELLKEVYPYASSKAKEDEDYLNGAREMTKRLQQRERGIFALWQIIMEVSKNDIKNAYDRLNTHFDLYKGESDADEYISELLNYLDKQNVVIESEGAKVIPVSKDTDKLEIPPMLLIKSDGGILYSTTELATLYERIKNYNPDEIWYVVDKRQELHFTQVFRAAQKSKIIDDNHKLEFIGFGTMNGKDGKPFKTRDGGVMELTTLLEDVKGECLKRLNESIKDNRDNIAEDIMLSTIKYADMLPNTETDYNFDLEKFCSLEGKTGPYILYSTIRMKSLLKKAEEQNLKYDSLKVLRGSFVRDLILTLTNFDNVLMSAFNNKSLNDITDYLYKIATTFNRFYTENIILSESDEDLRSSWLYLTSIVYKVNNILLNILAINVPERM